MSSADTQVLNGVVVDVHKTDEVKTASLVNGQQSANFFQLAMTALRLTAATTTTIPSNDRNNNNLRLRKQITLDEVAYHDTMNDCWIVLYDRVYDITNFLELHPGGHDVLLEHAGRDATIAFTGAGHSKAAFASLKMYEIGELPLHECMYRCQGMLKAFVLPD
ncbi:acyl-lipid (8-3)-desaturase B-like [Ochlerotatus camptorhynchus]|uniref:acyl-lipid (8-3)-desaturase B-like n=1 Tax=Ochlerotatus camptorhynchus TaxID=644619 RepID=UPI0031CEF487